MSNMRRWPMKPYWARFLDGAEKVKLFDKPGIEYNMGNLENFVFRQAGNAISAYLEICGEEVFRQRLKDRGTVMNPKYTELIRRYGKDGEK